MITDQYVTYEVAKLAKEKGFDVQTFGWYDYMGDYHKGFIPHELHECPRYKEYYAPTQSLLQKWLREEKWLHINVDYNHTNKSWTPTIIRMCCIPTRDTPYRLDLPSSSSYEVALEKALIYALNMLPSRETSK